MHPSARRVAVAALLAVTACKKDEAPLAKSDAGAAALVGATTPTISTGLGLARAIDGLAAPSSTRWERLWVTGRRAILAGESPAEADAILTDDEGKSFRSLRGDKRDWLGWSAGADGAVLLATGTREHVKAKANGERPIDAVDVRFAPFDAALLGEPSAPLPLPTESKLSPAKARGDAVVAAVFSKDLASFVVETGKTGAPTVVYTTPPGGAAPEPLALPKGERAAALPFGRPPALVTAKGGALLARAWPPAGERFDDPKPIGPFGGALAEIAAATPCDTDEWTFTRVGAGAARGTVIGVSAGRSVVIPVPQPIAKDARVGCAMGHVAVETVDPKTRGPQIVTCDLGGACVTPVNAPFRPWSEPHAQEILLAPTDKGVVAVLEEHDAGRWGIYVTQSVDGGKTFELARVVGEGVGDRGKLEVSALVAFGKRVLLLLAGDVAGTSRRGFYAIATDDGGTTWGPP